MEPKLKPCPFCGGTSVLRQDSDPGSFYVTFDHDGRCPLYAVPTDLFYSYATKAEAIAAWNIRSDTALEHAERLAKALGPFADGCGERPSYIIFGDDTEILAEHWDSARAALAAYNAWRLA